MRVRVTAMDNNIAYNNRISQTDGLTGRVVYLNYYDRANDAYPFGMPDVPAFLKAEYDNFYVATILPHRGRLNWDTSAEYTVTIDKHDIATGRMALTKAPNHRGSSKQTKGGKYVCQVAM